MTRAKLTLSTKTRATFNIYPMYIIYKMFKIRFLRGAEL